MKQHPEWFAFLDTEDIIPLGRHEDFFGADEAVPPKVNSVWIFRDEALRSLQLRIEQVLDTAPDVEQQWEDREKSAP
jgi:hypothetical protein